jgi:hypothetical protein
MAMKKAAAKKNNSYEYSNLQAKGYRASNDLSGRRKLVESNAPGASRQSMAMGRIDKRAVDQAARKKAANAKKVAKGKK